MDRRGFTIALVGAAAPWVARAQAREAPALLQRAGALLTLSQRLPKAWALLGLNIEAADAKRAVDECLEGSRGALAAMLAAPGLPAQARAAVQALDGLWQRARTQVAAAPSPKGLDALLVLDAQMLGIANEAAAHVMREGGGPALAPIDAAARLAMLSQRIAKFHFCALWGVAPRVAATQTTRAKADFLVQLEALRGAARSAPQREAIAAAQSQWVFFDAALEHSVLGAEAGVHARLARASEAILQVFADAAAKFARVG